MNISELARKLRISPKELRLILSAVGIDIGAKAIKIDKKLAKRILNEWGDIQRQYRVIKEKQQKEQEEEAKMTTEVKEVKIPSSISVRDFAARLDVPVNKLIEALMKSGIFVSLNERIDYDTAALIAMDLGIDVEKEEQEKETEITREKMLSDLLDQDDGEKKERPPVVVVMGHVDHGKTSLLDAIRKTNVIGGEAGGITQHIGAYQVEKNDRLITFIDTPGHEAFTAMRSRGARIADVAILVVAADDGVKPQTVEALKIIEKSKIPYIVAINKIDKEGANIEKTKKELSGHNVVSEDWGGNIICAPISAKMGDGIKELLDMVLLTVDLDKDKISVNYGGAAVGTIIESHIDKGEGPVATALVQKGILKRGDLININKNFSGKIRSMKDYNGKEVEEATPSTPVRLSGIKNLVNTGDVLEVTEEKGKIKKDQKGEQKFDYLAKTQEGEEEEDQGDRINVLLKADVLGSTEVIMESLEKLESKNIKIKVINRGLGNITESDVLQAEAIINNQHEDSMTVLVGFNVKSSPGVEILAKEKNVDIKIYYVIYEFLNEIEENIKRMAKVEMIKKETGKLSVLAIFKTEKEGMIIGGKVLSGKISKGEDVEVVRGKEVLATGGIENLQSGKEQVNFVKEGQECGMYYKGDPIIKEGDQLVFYTEEEVG